jgi:hypothetical protein
MTTEVRPNFPWEVSLWLVREGSSGEMRLLLPINNHAGCSYALLPRAWVGFQHLT